MITEREKKMSAKIYYSVVSSFADDGHTNAMITSATEAEKKPADSFDSIGNCDVYTDWFDSYEKAQRRVSFVLEENEQCKGNNKPEEYEHE